MKIELEINENGTLTFNGKIYAEVKSEPTDAPTTKESIFAEMVKDLVRKEDRAKYPNSVFWMDKEDNFMFEHDEKNAFFWCSYDRVWSVLKSKFGMKYDEIQAFTKGMVEEHFKCKVNTTTLSAVIINCAVEEHFKCKVNTTISK